MMNTLCDRLMAFVNETLLSTQSDAGAGPEDELLLSGLLDSIAIMRLVGFIETDLELPVPPEDVTLENFSSVRAIAQFLESQAASGA